MTTSSWDALEKKVYDTIAGLVVELGFGQAVTPPAVQTDVVNIHRYLPEHEQSDRLQDYYLTLINGAPEIRAWSVWTDQRFEFDSLRTVASHIDCKVTGYYEKGEQGAGMRLLKQHMSVVQQALLALDRNLGGTCTLIEDWTRVNYSTDGVAVADDEGEIVVGEFTISCLRASAVV